MIASLKDIIVIIPSLNPDEKMVSLVKSLISTFDKILILNDGSEKEYAPYYEDAKQCGAVLYTHCINMGKGRAIKDALNYAVFYWKEVFLGGGGVVFVDSDGQHALEDIVECGKKLIENPDSLILGSREFDSGQIPFRSRFGNIMTRNVLKALCGISVTDTQTGLRAISIANMKRFLNTKGERYEFEMNMLVETKEKNIPIVEVPIHTIYINSNETSHFHPVRDSWMIYKTFGKYLLASFSSFVIDMGLFSIFAAALRKRYARGYIGAATITARLLSSLYNYKMNKTYVFVSNPPGKTAVFKYFLLCLTLMALSALGVSAVVSYTGWNETVSKFLVDSLLFLASFFIQREFVFRKKEGTRQSNQEG